MATRPARKIIRIDEDKCDGCGECVPSCAEGAIQVIDGKARLVGENLCDGLGACLGTCPRGAIIIEERPAEAFDPEAVDRRKHAPAPEAQAAFQGGGACAGGCPGSMPRELRVLPLESSPGTSPHFAEKFRSDGLRTQPAVRSPARGSPGQGSVARGWVVQGAPMAGPLSQAAAERPSPSADEPATADAPSRLAHWPVQLALVPTAGPMWQGADVLIAADCVPFALPDFHEKLLRGKSLAVACPKLDDLLPHVEKLTRIFASNDIRSVTVAHMEVPCCWGIVQVVRRALEDSGKREIPLRDITVALSGTIL